MRRLIVLIGTIASLAGCSQQPAADSAPVGNVTAPMPVAAPSPSVAPATTLPAPLLGTWTADPAKRCTPGTELRIEVRADQIRFYESVARVTGVTQVDPHSWGIDATVTGEGETRNRSFDLNLNEDGTLTRVEAPIPDITYTRCESET